jgi:hypothetical protein
MGMYASTVTVTVLVLVLVLVNGAGRGIRRALTAEPSSRGVREQVARPGGRTP